MRLSTALARQTLEQLHEEPSFAEAVVVPDDNPAAEKLVSFFGDHTFFLDYGGLHIIEPANAPTNDVRTGQLIKLASWANPEHTALSPHRPEGTDVMIRLGSGDREEEA